MKHPLSLLLTTLVVLLVGCGGGGGSSSSAPPVTNVPNTKPPTCSTGQVLRGGVCVTPTPTPTPPPTCPTGQVLQGGTCVTPTPTACEYGEVRISGICRKYTIPEQQERALNHYVPGVWAIAQNATTKTLVNNTSKGITWNMFEEPGSDHEEEMRCYASFILSGFYDYEDDGCLDASNNYFTVFDDTQSGANLPKTIFSGYSAATIVSWAVGFDCSSILADANVDFSDGAAIVHSLNNTYSTNSFHQFGGCSEDKARVIKNIADNSHNILLFSSTDDDFGTKCDDDIASVCVLFDENITLWLIEMENDGKFSDLTALMRKHKIDTNSRGNSYGATVGGALALMVSRVLDLDKGEQALTVIKSCAVPKTGFNALGVVSLECLFDSEGNLKTYSGITTPMSSTASAFRSLTIPGGVGRIRMYDSYGRTYNVSFSHRTHFSASMPDIWSKKRIGDSPMFHSLSSSGQNRLTYSLGMDVGDFFFQYFHKYGSNNFFGSYAKGIKQNGLAAGLNKGPLTLAVVVEKRKGEQNIFELEGVTHSALIRLSKQFGGVEAAVQGYCSAFEGGFLVYGREKYSIGKGENDCLFKATLRKTFF